jgi:GNAT superfamily N-acetyltransferase
VVVPVYHDLSPWKQNLKPEETAGLEFVVLDRDNAESVSALNKITSRRLKGTYNTSAGYYAYAVVSNGEVIGDMWCAAPGRVQCDPIHPDLTWLGIECGEREVYMFDLFVAPGSRGKVVTGFLVGNALRHLKESGVTRVYGFYEKNNLPALWTHRLFGYKELQMRKISRFFLYQKSEALPSAK